MERPPSASSSARELSPVARRQELEDGPKPLSSKPSAAVSRTPEAAVSRTPEATARPPSTSRLADPQPAATAAALQKEMPTVNLSRLPPPARERMLDMLARSRIEFREVDEDGLYEAVIRVRGRGQRTIAAAPAPATASPPISPLKKPAVSPVRRASASQAITPASVPAPTVGRRKSQPTNILSAIDEFFDFCARVVEDKGPEYFESPAGVPGVLRSFFAHRMVSSPWAATDEACKNLIDAVDRVKEKYASARMFLAIIHRSLDVEDLLFLLFARSKVMKRNEQHIGPQGASTSLKQVRVSVERAKTLIDELFGSDAPFLKERIMRSFFFLLSDRHNSATIGVSHSTTIGTTKEPAIDVDSFLERCLHTFHQARFPDSTPMLPSASPPAASPTSKSPKGPPARTASADSHTRSPGIQARSRAASSRSPEAQPRSPPAHSKSSAQSRSPTQQRAPAGEHLLPSSAAFSPADRGCRETVNHGSHPTKSVSRERVAILRAQFSPGQGQKQIPQAPPMQVIPPDKTGAWKPVGAKRLSAPAVLTPSSSPAASKSLSPSKPSVDSGVAIPTELEELLLEPETNEALPIPEAQSSIGETAMDAKEHAYGSS